MDILSFVNSSDIRNHLKEINYEFSTLEAAWLIYQSTNHTVYEKLKSLQELMEIMPDCKIKERCNTVSQDSLFSYLKKYIQNYNELIVDFFKSNGVFTIEIKHSNPDFDYFIEGLFNDFDTVRNQCLFEYKKQSEIDSFKIRKYSVFSQININNYSPNEVILRANDLSVMSADYGTDNIDKYAILDDVFFGLWFDFPIPFKIGDIVCNIRKSNKPFVLYSISFKDTNSRVYNNLKANGDETDMAYCGYYPMEDGSLFSDCDWNYMDLEYYHNELLNEEKMLLPISCFLKGNIDIGLCCNSFHSIIMQLLAEGSIPKDCYSSDLKKLEINKKEIKL